MNKLQRSVEYSILLLVLIGSVLLSASIGSYRLFFVALICSVTGFIVTDTFKLFRIQGWLANVVSIGILVLAMKDFFDADSSGKLIAVANLLVYLQSILMFQEKTPRLNWQVLVLSLLEVVIATIFTLGFSNFFLLLVYFIIAGIAMLLQCLLVDELDIARRNRSIARRMLAVAPVVSTGASDATAGANAQRQWRDRKRPNVTLMFDAQTWQHRNLWPVLVQLSGWIIAGLAMTSIVFLMAPRTTKPLFQSITYKVSATGFNNSVDLNEKGRIRQSNRVMFRAEFQDPTQNFNSIQLLNSPYFRSMALGSLKIKDGHTSWKAPFDRIDATYYQPIVPSSAGKRVRQVITLEQNTSPQIYSTMPFFLASNTPSTIRFCQEISALTRCKYDGKVAAAPFNYELGTTLDYRNRTLAGWPYVSQSLRSRDSMEDEPMRQRWLTQIDVDRYPSLVQTADAIASEVDAQGGSRRETVEKMTDWFSSNRYKYTLDYTNVERDETIDAVEDFFRNHRSGHCEMYASALTLMLRSQGIPARLVVGFLANDYNELTQKYVVKEKHAHAWVEAYLRPEDCTIQMQLSGMAGAGGCWLVADPNPVEVLSSDYSVSNDPIELARTVWQDLVMGNDDQMDRNELEDASLLYRIFFDVKTRGTSFVSTVKSLPREASFQLVIAGLLIAFALVQLLRNLSKQPAGERKQRKKIGLLRRMVASAAGLLSHELESWVLSSAMSDRTEFYIQMETLLKQHELERVQTQTHRQFASEASAALSHLPQSVQIGRLIHSLTEQFNAVRFGEASLTEEQEQSLQQSVRELESVLASSDP